MDDRSIEISPAELLTLVEWVSTFEKPPTSIKIIQDRKSGIGRSVRCEVETAEGEGRFKDVTDYNNW